MDANSKKGNDFDYRMIVITLMTALSVSLGIAILLKYWSVVTVVWPFLMILGFVYAVILSRAIRKRKDYDESHRT
ncbi:MAG TPA: hypothetical protein VNJ08_06255 [Bacteriovoracaceae bacterium]|nr:hypothetical protein [Bacteriovoracaceae bacterium]